MRAACGGQRASASIPGIPALECGRGLIDLAPMPVYLALVHLGGEERALEVIARGRRRALIFESPPNPGIVVFCAGFVLFRENGEPRLDLHGRAQGQPRGTILYILA